MDTPLNPPVCPKTGALCVGDTCCGERFAEPELITATAPATPSAPTEAEVVENIVVRPAHYTQYEIEPITFIMKNRLSFETGNMVKYAVRAGSKVYDGLDKLQSEITDLKKVIRYAEMRPEAVVTMQPERRIYQHLHCHRLTLPFTGSKHRTLVYHAGKHGWHVHRTDHFIPRENVG
jgi:Protein of unknwon function (DUF3310)